MNISCSTMLSSLLKSLRLLKAYYVYRNQSLKYMKWLGIRNSKVAGEEEYVQKWSQLSRKVDIVSYRLYSHYCGCIPDIVPEDPGKLSSPGP